MRSNYFRKQLYKNIVLNPEKKFLFTYLTFRSILKVNEGNTIFYYNWYFYINVPSNKSPFHLVRNLLNASGVYSKQYSNEKANKEKYTVLTLNSIHH